MTLAIPVMARLVPTRCTHLKLAANPFVATRWSPDRSGAPLMPPSLGRFGHARRQATGIALLERLVEVGQFGVSVRSLGGGRSGEVRFGRFLRCDAVTPKE